MGETEELDMPPCDAGHMIGYLFDIGPTMAAGMGDGPITHGEIESFRRNTGIEFDAWESRTLRCLSAEYSNESHKATARDCPAPWADAPYAKPVTTIATERTRNALRALASL